jgi:hypothetical protein
MTDRTQTLPWGLGVKGVKKRRRKQNTLAPLDAAIDSEKENEDRVGE